MMSLVSCDSRKNQKDRTLRVGVVTYTPDDPFINAMTDILKEDLKALEASDMKVIVSVRSGDNSQQEQDEVVEEMIDAGCDVLCVNLVDRTAPSNIIRLARQNNIPVIFFNREPVREDLLQWDRLYYVGCDAAQSGEMQGEIAAEYIKNHPEVDRNQDGKIQYVLLEGEAGHQDAIVRTECSVNMLIESGVQVEKLGYAIANWNRAQAQTKVASLLTQYPGQMELILANNDDMALGAIDALKASGLSRDEWPAVVGIDGTDPGLEAVEKGEMVATVYNDKEGQADGMLNLAFALATDEGLDEIGLENDRYIRLPYQKVTRENVSDFQK